MMWNLFDLSAEITGVSAMLTGLSIQFDDDADTLTSDAMKNALFGLARHLDRISAELEAMSAVGDKGKDGVAA